MSSKLVIVLYVIALGGSIGIFAWLSDRRSRRIDRMCATAGVRRWKGETDDHLLERYRGLSTIRGGRR